MSGEHTSNPPSLDWEPGDRFWSLQLVDGTCIDGVAPPPSQEEIDAANEAARERMAD